MKLIKIWGYDFNQFNQVLTMLGSTQAFKFLIVNGHRIFSDKTSFYHFYSAFENSKMILESYYQIIDCTLIGRDQVFEIAQDGSFQPIQAMLDALCLKKEEFLSILYYDYFNQELDEGQIKTKI